MKFLKTHSDHELKRIKKTVKQILELQPEYAQLSDEQLKSKTKEFKQRLKEESLNDLLPEAYAAIREADKRVLGMEPFRSWGELLCPKDGWLKCVQEKVRHLYALFQLI